VPVRHPGRWIAAGVVAVLVAMLVNTLAFSTLQRGAITQDRFQWDVIGQYLTAGPVIAGVVKTIELTAAAMGIAIALGVVLALMRLSANPLLKSASWVYIWFFRGTPVYVQLIFWFNIAALYPQLGFGVPFGPIFYHLNVNAFFTPFLVALVGLGLNEAAYMAEIVRAGIISVDLGQMEAAQSLGMTRLSAMRRVVLPQAMRLIVPPTGNETISMLKTSSLAVVVTLPELLFSVETIYNRTYQTMPLLMVACIWYLAMTTVLTIGQYYLERRFARGSSRELPPTPFQRLRRMLLTGRTPPALPVTGTVPSLFSGALRFGGAERLPGDG
jgi:polar amino acid transport system permease protein